MMPGRSVVVVSRFNEAVTRRLLDGALNTLAAEGYAHDQIEVIWIPGAFELPLAVDRALATGRYQLAIALGAVIRGETAHFEYISSAASRGLSEVATRRGLPVGFGLLTCDTEEQALARAGGDAGNKGAEAAVAAIEMARVLATFQDRAQS